MKDKRCCWNICCICWEENEELHNCSADDLNPDICRLSHLDLRSILETAEQRNAKKIDRAIKNIDK
jgi:hypothetical protein